MRNINIGLCNVILSFMFQFLMGKKDVYFRIELDTNRPCLYRIK